MYKNLYSLMMTFENAISHTCCVELDILITAPLPLPRAQLNFKVARHRARNRELSAGLEPVLSQTQKLCIASNNRQLSTNIKMKIIKLIPF